MQDPEYERLDEVCQTLVRLSVEESHERLHLVWDDLRTREQRMVVGALAHMVAIYRAELERLDPET